MATTKHPPMVSLFTDYEKNSVRVLVVGGHGTLAFTLQTDGPTIAIPDSERGAGRYKAVAGLEANGRLTGWFVEQKSAQPGGRYHSVLPGPEAAETASQGQEEEAVTNRGELRLPCFCQQQSVEERRPMETESNSPASLRS